MEMGFPGMQPVSNWKAAHWLEMSHRRWGLREREREKLLTDWPWVSGESGEPRQARHQGRWRCPEHTAEPQRRSRPCFRDRDPRRRGGVSSLRCDVGLDDMGPSPRRESGL